MSEPPLHASRREAKNLWQEYRIYGDRVELRAWTGRWVIPLPEIEGVEVAGPIQTARLRLRADLGYWPRQLKLDAADFAEHVALSKSGGLIRQLFFTPDDPATFKRVLDGAPARCRGLPGQTC